MRGVAKLPDGASYPVDDEYLFGVFSEARLIKSVAELDLMRYSCAVSSEAHMAVMAHTKPGMFEYQLESLFKVRPTAQLHSFLHRHPRFV